MLGVDTNVLVRYLVRDDETQFVRAQRLIRRQTSTGRPVFISLLVLVETEWVLRSRYSVSKDDAISTFSGLLDSADVQFEDEPTVEEALFTWKNSSAEFADCLIAARNRKLGCSATASFDSKASRLPGFVAA